MSEGAIVLPTDMDDEVALADWLEATMLVEGRAHFSRSLIRRYLISELAASDADIAIDVLLNEIARRQRACPDGYPFAEHENGVRYSQSEAGVPYVFLLTISTSVRYRKEHRQRDTDELFDLLVLDALKQYLGPGVEGLRFGAPASGRRPRNFQDAIAWLAKDMNLPLGAGHARRVGGDGGLDVIVWRPFLDKRSGYVVILTQCTVQREWFDKAKDLTEDVWRGWIDLGKGPHLALAIPFVISAGYEKWDMLRRTVHTVLDRLRLCELLGRTGPSERARIGKWTAREVKAMAEST
jgi:hypothetical protein